MAFHEGDLSRLRAASSRSIVARVRDAEPRMLKEIFTELLSGLSLKKPPPEPEVKHGFLRRNFEGFATAVAYALLIKQFAIDTFQVPTESMEPVIIGRDAMGDRILVDRLDYMTRDPERYEIVVFKYPLSRLVNYVKRAVGLPGERVQTTFSP
jgi:signal peptidase I